jgi:hypothetical protein
VSDPWEPANDTERAMVRAAQASDQRAFFQTLAAADLVLPRFTQDDDHDGQRFVTAGLFGQTFLVVFTSVEAMAARLPGLADGYALTGYAELSQKWPHPEWRLAVNPGTPLEAYVPIDAIAAAASGDLVVATAAELVAEAEAAVTTPPDVDAELTEAAAAGDVNRYAAALLDAVVLIPTGHQVADPAEILEPGFPWRRTGPPDQPMIEAFTSPEILDRAYPDGTPNVPVALPFALAVWPDGCGLSVNPGEPSGIELPSDQVQWLLLWESLDGDGTDDPAGRSQPPPPSAGGGSGR